MKQHQSLRPEMNIICNEFLNVLARKRDLLLRANAGSVVRLNREQSNEIREIRAALTRIQRKSFGLCRVCENFIELERLRAAPCVQICSQCDTF